MFNLISLLLNSISMKFNSTRFSSVLSTKFLTPHWTRTYAASGEVLLNNTHLTMCPMLVSDIMMKSSSGERAMPLGMYRESSRVRTWPVWGSYARRRPRWFVSITWGFNSSPSHPGIFCMQCQWLILSITHTQTHTHTHTHTNTLTDSSEPLFRQDLIFIPYLLYTSRSYILISTTGCI